MTVVKDVFVWGFLSGPKPDPHVFGKGRKNRERAERRRKQVLLRKNIRRSIQAIDSVIAEYRKPVSNV